MVQFVTHVDEDHRDLVEARLVEFNNRRSPTMRGLRGLLADDEQPLHVYALDGATATGTGRTHAGGATAEERVVGGLVGYTWGHWLHIDLLWVSDERRGCGVGTRLVRRAEEAAKARGCVHSRVESWSFQAPGFYQKLGYRVIGVVEDYPPGETDYLLTRALGG